MRSIINRKLTLFILIISLFIFLMVSPLSYKRNIKIIETPANETVYGIQNALYYITDIFKDIWFQYIYLVDLGEENKRLKREFDKLNGEIAIIQEDLQSFQRLKELNNFNQKSRYNLVTAEIIGSDPTNWFKTIVINAGSKKGISEDMGVISANGVVGKIIKVSPNFSRAVLLLDRSIIVPAMISRTREQGLVEGKRDQVIMMKYLPIKSKIEVGDKIITSGLLGFFPKGILIGEVIEIYRVEVNQFIDLEIKPSVDFKYLEEVFVVINDKETQEELSSLDISE